MKFAASFILPFLVAVAIFSNRELVISPTDDEHRVAIVVDYGGGEVASRCVTFAEDHISGLEALQRAGLDLELDVQAGGAAVCRIGNSGCPAENCFCACPGGADCLYWSYWHMNGEEWQYSLVGSGQYEVQDGGLEGWVWGPGSVTEASPPPQATFSEICSDDGSVNSPNRPASSVNDRSVESADSASQETQSLPPDLWLSYAGFMMIVLFLIAIGVVASKRRSVQDRDYEP